MAQAVQAAGGRFLDVPMTRTPKEAAEGRLNLLAGGDPALLEECRPLLQCFSEDAGAYKAVAAAVLSTLEVALARAPEALGPELPAILG